MKARARFSCFALGALVASASLFACDGPLPDKPPGNPIVSAPPEPLPASVAVAWNKSEFNKIAARANVPLFWTGDANANGKLEPEEIAVLWGADAERSAYVAEGKFTRDFVDAVTTLMPRYASEPADPRLALVVQELDQGYPTLVSSDFTSSSEQDKNVVKHVLDAARGIERVYLKQVGAWLLREKIPADDHSSQSLFHRNQGPWCVAPATEKNPLCSALAGSPKKISGLYPEKLQENPDFCEGLKQQANAEALRDPFNVVMDRGAGLEAVPYTKFYAADLAPIADDLDAAAQAITSADEAPFKRYLEAAATSFRTNDWKPADEAWAAMNVRNSKWYLRVGPDEVYFEPCSLKAGFHVSFARINQDSLTWQNKLDPVKTEMDQALALVAGKPYTAREVAFKLPDFIDIILNAGDSRNPTGATIGQSLPNWGPVANEGRGRTVAMTNLFTDADSRKTLESQASSLFCAATMSKFTSDPAPQVMGTVLHEAAHNLGPSHEYEVKGKKATEIFDGPLASMLEELKAETAALFFTDWLITKGLVSPELAEQAHVRSISWAFGHISRGMYESTGRARPYSQLAQIQVLFLQEAGAIEWKAADQAANATDVGCMELHLDKFPGAVDKLMRDVAGIKARGDKKRALELKQLYVDVDGDKKKLADTITERWLRAPKASLVYSIER